MPQSFYFLFQQHTHLQVKQEPPLVLFSLFLLLAPNSYCRLDVIISSSASNNLYVHLTADWSDAACCQPLRQCARYRVRLRFSFFSLLPRAESVLYARLCLACASFAHLQKMYPLALFFFSVLCNIYHTTVYFVVHPFVKLIWWLGKHTVRISYVTNMYLPHLCTIKIVQKYAQGTHVHFPYPHYIPQHTV